MLAVNLGTHTHQVISWNIFHNEHLDVWEVWITRPNGKNMMVAQGSERDMNLVKSAFDYAFEHDKKIVTL